MTRWILAAPNPVAGVTINPDVFGADFSAWFRKLFGGFWWIGLLVAAGALLWSLVTLYEGHRSGISSGEASARKRAVWAGFGLAVTSAAVTIIGAVVTAGSP